MTTDGREPPPGADDTRPNPYAGPRALHQGEPIYGRVREINELRGLILSERIVLLYSQSGAGKTSLIEAGLRPEFEQRRFIVLPTVRVGYESPTETPGANRYRLSVLASLESVRPADEQLTAEELVSISLKDYFQRINTAEPDSDLFIVFDQFEEVFTLDPTDWGEKEAFLHELGMAMTNRSIFALFSMREDFIAQLDPYQSSMPTRFSNTYRLELLGPSDARLAIQKPAQAAGVDFADDAAQGLVDDLRRVRVDRGATSVLELGPSVEPVQLQVVCSQLWEHLDTDATVIQSHDVDDTGNVNEALAGYYTSQVAAVAGNTRVRESDIRDWFEEKLISDDGFRTQTRDGPGRKKEKVLAELEDAHLIRADRRRGTQWYELTHDRFVDPIRTSNAEFHRRRRTKRLKILVPVAALALIALTSIVVDVLATSTMAGSEVPATTISGTSSEAVFVVDASQVMRYKFDDGKRGDEVTLLVTAKSTDPSIGIQPEVDVRLLQVGTADSADGLEAGATRSVAPSGATAYEASIAATSGAGANSTTTSTTKALQETDRPITRNYSLPADGSYFIEISATSAASIAFSYQRVAGTAAPELTFGDGVQGQLDVSGAVGRFAFTVGDDETVELILESFDGLDGVLVLLDDDEQALDSVDASGVGQRESLVRTLEDGGNYIVNVAGFEGTVGAYTLSLGRLDTSVLDGGETVVDATLPAGAATVYSFAADPGEVVSIVLTHGQSTSPTLEVSSASGRQYDFADLPGEPIEFAQVWAGGTGLVIVRDDSDIPGEFSLELKRLTGTSIGIDESVESSGQPGQPLYFTFEAERGEVYSVDTSLVEIAPDVLAPGDVPILAPVFVAPFDGDYLVVVEPDSAEAFTTVLRQPDVPEIDFGGTRSGEVVDTSESVAYTFPAEAGDTYSVTFGSTGLLPPFLLLVTAQDGLPEVFDFGWTKVTDLPADLTCDQLFAMGLPYQDAVLYAVVFDFGEELCEDVYPTQDVDQFFDTGVPFQLTVTGITPFDGEYLITVVPGDIGPYEISLER